MVTSTVRPPVGVMDRGSEGRALQVMTAGAWSLTLMVAMAAQAASPAAQEEQVRTVLMPARGQALEVFVRAFDTKNPYLVPLNSLSFHLEKARELFLPMKLLRPLPS